MSLFEIVKENVSALDVAKAYGLPMNRSGMTNCIFHNDRTPSLKLYDGVKRGFYCFSCGASGSVIDLAAQLFSISPKEAALKLSHDFNISVYALDRPALSPTVADTGRQQRHKAKHYRNTLLFYLGTLEKWINYGPSKPDEKYNFLFLEALEKKDRVEYITDLLLYGTDEEIAELIEQGEGELKEYEARSIHLASLQI